MFKPKCEKRYSRTSGGDIHKSFGLTRSAYYVVPRLALQEMPRWWQWAFVLLVNMLPDTPEYTVQRRDKKGRFIQNEPWSRYRHSSVEKAQK